MAWTSLSSLYSLRFGLGSKTSGSRPFDRISLESDPFTVAPFEERQPNLNVSRHDRDQPQSPAKPCHEHPSASGRLISAGFGQCPRR